MCMKSEEEIEVKITESEAWRAGARCVDLGLQQFTRY
jgi:hypothetical protein